MKVVLDESGFGMKVVWDEKIWDEKRHFHPNLDESVPNLWEAWILWVGRGVVACCKMSGSVALRASSRLGGAMSKK